MSARRSLASWLFLLVFVAVVAASAYNFFTVGPLVEPTARAAVCAKRAKCAATMVRLFRNPLWSDVDFRVGSTTVSVRCARSAYLFGPYSCSER
jgi:hypothetical protein